MITSIERQRGFTLVELMVVIVIIGMVLVFLLPRAYRASVESKYQLLRQTSTELASWANEWAEKEIEVQPALATSNLNDYMATLGDDGSVDWVANSGNNSNWQDGGNPAVNLEDVANRGGTGVDDAPSTCVKEIMSQDKMLTNPFNGLSVFSSGNDPVAEGHAVTGAIGCAWIDDVDTSFSPSETYHYYALVFQGTESSGTSGDGAFYAGQNDSSLEGLRNGIFINRLMP
jgi:prepilin-type N-terminal cleavage/methylation domain-containing protein